MDNDALMRRLEREKNARKQAEALLEAKSLELYKANLKLSQQTDQLEEKIAERTEHLNKALNEARSASRVKRQFISNISHELRTPLNGVLGTLQLLSGRPMDDAQRKLINQAVVSAERLKVLISDMLDMSRLESGAVQLDEYEFNFGSMLRELVDSFIDQARQKGVTIRLSGMANSDLHVNADPVRLRQILFSLLDNAIKFTESGSVDIHVGLKDVTAQKFTLFVSVADTGVGIAPDKLDAIFEYFTQADDSANRRYQGAGLGLATSSQLLQMMDARLHVLSEQGKGSTFWFKMPVRHDNAINNSIENQHALLVAPYDGDRTFTLKDLAQAGMDVTVANDSQEMLKNLNDEQCHFDVVLIDERITECDGDIFLHEYPEVWRLRTVLLCLSKQKSLSHAITHRFVSVLERPLETALLSPLLSLLNEAGEYWSDPFEEVLVSHEVTKATAPSAFSELQTHTEGEAPNQPKEFSDCWRGKVLLVEDNRVNALIAIEMLKILEIETVWVMDGSEAIKALKQDRFGLVLMDCQMPIMDGYEATRRIRAGEAGEDVKLIPIVALTADNPRQGLHSFMMCDMNGWLPKPLESSRLLMEMNRHLLKRDFASEISFDARLKSNPPLGLALLQHWQSCLAELMHESSDLHREKSDTWMQESMALLVEIADALNVDALLSKIRDSASHPSEQGEWQSVFVGALSELKQHINSKLHAIQEAFH